MSCDGNVDPPSCPDGKSPDPMKSLKRRREDKELVPPSDNHHRLSEPSPKRRRQQRPTSSLPTPPRSEPALAEPPSSTPSKKRKRSQAFERPRHASEPCRSSPVSWSSTSEWVQQTVDAIPEGRLAANAEILPTTEGDADDMRKPRDEESPVPAPSTAGSTAERGSTSSPLYRRVLEMNDVFIDNFGDKIPEDVQALISKHIRKARMSPKLDDGQKTEIREGIKAVWTSPEAIIADLIKPPLFHLRHPELSEGRDTIWSTIPLPRDPEYGIALAAPKTDRHYGFDPGPAHWTKKQLSAADHPTVRPYSQPTQANIYPFFLMELKSEATGGTLFGAEGQLATSGAHRVASWIWTQQQINPSRELLSADAVVFSAAVTQRQVAAHVHYFNPVDSKYWMSLIDTFTFSSKEGMQECRDYVKNVVEWMVDVQKLLVRASLDDMYPLFRQGRRRTRDGESTTSDGRPHKKAKNGDGRSTLLE